MGKASLFGGVGGYDTSDANITENDVASGKIAFGAEGEILGTSSLSYTATNADGVDEYQATNLPLEITADGCETKVLREATIQGEWTSGTISTASTGNKISAYGDGKLVVLEVGSATAHYSTDNTNWIAITLPVSSNWYGLVFADGKFTANSMSGIVIQSTDGITWTQVSTLFTPSYNLGSVVYGGGKYIIPQVGNTFTTGYISEDGCATWQDFIWPSDQNWAWGAYGAGKFVFVSQSSVFCYSTDGKNWTQGTFPSGGNNMFSQIVFFNGLFIAFDILSYGVTAYSNDGTNWTIGSCGVSFFRPFLAQGNDRLILLNDGDNTGAYTEDGVNWISFSPTAASGGIDTGFSAVSYGNGEFVAFENSSRVVHTQTYKNTILLSSLITFTIEGVSYTAYEGMTWGEWIESKWNNGVCFIDSYGNVCYRLQDGTYNGVYYKGYHTADSIIIDGADYTNNEGSMSDEPT